MNSHRKITNSLTNVTELQSDQHKTKQWLEIHNITPEAELALNMSRWSKSTFSMHPVKFKQQILKYTLDEQICNFRLLPTSK